MSEIKETVPNVEKHEEAGGVTNVPESPEELRHVTTIDPEVERRVVRKIDLRLVPLVTALCTNSHSTLPVYVC